MNAGNRAARLFCVISLYYGYRLFCRDKTMCVDVLHKEGEEAGGRGGEE